MHIKIILFLVIILSATLFTADIFKTLKRKKKKNIIPLLMNIHKIMMKTYFKENAVKINAINNMIEENNKLLSLHE